MIKVLDLYTYIKSNNIVITMDAQSKKSLKFILNSHFKLNKQSDTA
jgi:tRNA threonylcarbamoyladenosine modification (KEOPS) complex  Pcc1 subunit